MSKQVPLDASPRRPISDDDGYKVGPGKPPRHTQFKKGQSGNPGGRKKERLDFPTLLLEEFQRSISIKGSDEILSALQAVIRKQMIAALSGNPRAMKDMLDRMERMSRLTSGPELVIDDPEDDEAMIARAMRRRPGPDSGSYDDEDDAPGDADG